MIALRPAGARGHAHHGWLDAWHSFSFAEYFDPEHMGWGVLRVLNDDTIAPGQGFGTHGHRDMEIVTYVLEGALEHRDSLGNGEIIRPGEVQRMSAGRGVMHSEFNPSPTARTHLLQIWLHPAARGLPASYEQVVFPPEEKHNRLRLIASPDGAQGSVTLHQDARLYAACPEAGVTLTHTFAPARLGYLHVIRGALVLAGRALGTGDGAKIADESALAIEAREAAEFLLFDLPPAARD